MAFKTKQTATSLEDGNFSPKLFKTGKIIFQQEITTTGKNH